MAPDTNKKTAYPFTPTDRDYFASSSETHHQKKYEQLQDQDIQDRERFKDIEPDSLYSYLVCIGTEFVFIELEDLKIGILGY